MDVLQVYYVCRAGFFLLLFSPSLSLSGPGMIPGINDLVIHI